MSKHGCDKESPWQTSDLRPIRPNSPDEFTLLSLWLHYHLCLLSTSDLALPASENACEDFVFQSLHTWTKENNQTCLVESLTSETDPPGLAKEWKQLHVTLTGHEGLNFQECAVTPAVYYSIIQKRFSPQKFWVQPGKGRIIIYALKVFPCPLKAAEML